MEGGGVSHPLTHRSGGRCSPSTPAPALAPAGSSLRAEVSLSAASFPPWQHSCSLLNGSGAHERGRSCFPRCPQHVPRAGLCSWGQAGATEPGASHRAWAAVEKVLGRREEHPPSPACASHPHLPLPERGTEPTFPWDGSSSGALGGGRGTGRGMGRWDRQRDGQRDRWDVHVVPPAATTLKHRPWLGGCTQRCPCSGGSPQHPWPGLPCGARACPQWGEGE